MGKRQGRWSREEDAEIRASYGTCRSAVIANRLGRSVDAVERRFDSLFPVVTTDGPEGWTPAREERLGRMLGSASTDVMARVLGLTKATLILRLESLRAARRPRPWTRSEDTLLRSVFGSRDDEGLSLLFGRPPADVVARAKELAVSKDKAYRRRQYGVASTVMPRWSKVELQQLRALYPTHSSIVIARRLGRSAKSVHSMAARLHLRKAEARMSEMGRENNRHRRPR